MKCAGQQLGLRIDRRGRAHHIEDVPAAERLAAIVQKDYGKRTKPNHRCREFSFKYLGDQ